MKAKQSTMSSSNQPRKREQKNGRNKRRRAQEDEFRPAWKKALGMPDFLDASASVSASTFGARRLPEIKALWNATMKFRTKLIPSEEALSSSGRKTSSRHLRRRTTTHKSRKRHRYPEGPKKDDDKNDDLRSRRATRKNKAALCGPHESWWKADGGSSQNHRENNNAMETNRKEAVQLNWITTHIWHAKRFHMADLWGWQIPMVHTNRGPKAALRLIREGKTLIQDVTWRMAEPIIVQASTQENQGQETITSVIRRICPEFQMNTEISDTSTGQGMLYEKDQFPKNAIGPITWFISSGRPLLGKLKLDQSFADSSHFYFYFWVHPLTQSNALNQFLALREESASIFDAVRLGFEKGDGSAGIAWFQLRGSVATSTLKTILADPREADISCKAGNERLMMGDDKMHTTFTHGTMISAQCKLDTGSVASDDRAGLGGWVGGNHIAFVSQCLRDPSNLPQNASALGWDVVCDASVAKDIFVKLTIDGSACPIGVVEEAYISLECEPPISNVFPRDYPETHQGLSYWELVGEVENGGDLQVLRLCLEEGEAGGRVQVPLIKQRVRAPVPLIKQRGRGPLAKQKPTSKVSNERLLKIIWSGLVASSTNKSSTDNPSDQVVVMRGMFGQPLLDALSRSGIVPPQHDASETSRRKRRRSKEPNEISRTLPLSPQDTELHVSSCIALLESLSLPAVILCHLVVVGPGTFVAGSEIHCYEDSQLPALLGYTTAGCFSVARGCYHGTGVVAASSLLRAIIWASSNAQQSVKALAVIGRCKAGADMREIRLQVQVKCGKVLRTACLLPIL